MTTNHPTEQLVMLPNHTDLRLCLNPKCDVVAYDDFLTERCVCNHVGPQRGTRWSA